MVLTERWPDLAALPRVAIATLPTRITRLDAVSRQLGVEVSCKRDDETARPYGGNKVRKLEWLLGEAEARKARSIVTIGAEGSHHVLATAIYAAQRGFEVHAVRFPQPRTEHVAEVAHATERTGATLHEARGPIAAAARMAAVVARLELGGKRPYVIPVGGSSAVGAVGYVEAGLEIAAAVDARMIDEPEAIFVAAGSGGTAAGLAVGLTALGLVTRVVAVRVTNRLAIHAARLERLARDTVSRLRAVDPRFPDVAALAAERIVIDGTMRGPGYGVPTPEGSGATALAAEDGLLLDATYTGKAFAALLAGVRAKVVAKRCMFLSSLSSAPGGEIFAGQTDVSVL